LGFTTGSSYEINQNHKQQTNYIIEKRWQEKIHKKKKEKQTKPAQNHTAREGVSKTTNKKKKTARGHK